LTASNRYGTYQATNCTPELPEYLFSPDIPAIRDATPTQASPEVLIAILPRFYLDSIILLGINKGGQNVCGFLNIIYWQ
jgi:hypothetical protein